MLDLPHRWTGRSCGPRYGWVVEIVLPGEVAACDTPCVAEAWVGAGGAWVVGRNPPSPLIQPKAHRPA